MIYLKINNGIVGGLIVPPPVRLDGDCSLLLITYNELKRTDGDRQT